MTTQRQKTVCPHCGAENSSGRRLCFQCQQEMAVKPEPQAPVAKRRLQPATAPGQVITAEQVRATKAARIDAPTAPPRDQARLAVILGATLGQRAQLYHQLHSLLRAGVPLTLSLNYLGDNVAPHLRGLVREMVEAVQRGGRFSEVMARYPTLFPNWEVALVRAHEKAGTLPEAMSEIAEQLDLEADMRRRTNAATLHLKATFLVFILVFFIVGGVGGVTGLSDVLTALGGAFAKFVIAVAAIIGAWQGWKALSLFRGGARFVQFIITRTPMIGPIMRNIQRLRFARVLGALWDAGVSPTEALETAAAATANDDLVFRTHDQMVHLQSGGTIGDAVEALRIFPQEAIYLLKSGEVSGTVGASLANVAQYIALELDAQVKTLPARLQLLFYAVIVPFIAYFIIRFYVGYFDNAMSAGE
jgi:type II secretory pathway component PulF